MNTLAVQSEAHIAANDNGATSLPGLVKRASAALAGATTAAEVLDAKSAASFAYDAAKAAGRLAKAKGAYDDVIGAVYRAQADALEIEAMAKRRLADEYDAAQERGEVAGHGGARNFKVRDVDLERPTVMDVGLTKQDIYEARIVRDAEVESPGIVRAALDALVESGEEPTKAALAREIKSPAAYRTSFTGNNEWYTPAKYIDLARDVMGGIDLDPASNDHAQKTVKASVYYTAENSGLDKEWNGRVWMNPPYSQPEIMHFIDKIAGEASSCRVTEAIVLTHNSTDTRWFDVLFKSAAAICFTSGRVRFESPTGEKAAPAMGQSFAYFGENPDRFADVFGEVGNIVIPYRSAA